jgi:hypothetical protein
MTIDLDVSPTFGFLVDVFLQFSFWCFKNNAWNINLHVWEMCENNFKKKSKEIVKTFYACDI